MAGLLLLPLPLLLLLLHAVEILGGQRRRLMAAAVVTTRKAKALSANGGLAKRQFRVIAKLLSCGILR
jgi:hypothetical protein